MRAPDAALVRARAKAPLADLSVLHLSSADLTCLRNLEACRQLRSLYASANLIRDIDGLASLRCLWRIDLSGNQLKNLQPLATFPALGFVNLERNGLSFSDLACLRDVHIVELRVTAGNRALLKDDGSLATARRHTVALLPYVWALDSHYVTTSERADALEACDAFVSGLLARSSDSGHRFGAMSDVWTGTDTLGTPVQAEAMALLDTIAKQPSRQPLQQDLYRLRALATIHDRECDVHNGHVQFAPSRQSVDGRRMARIQSHTALALCPRARLELSVLLATMLEFSLPAKLLAEAMTIVLLSGHAAADGERATQWVDDLTHLPPYAMVALLAALRSKAILSDSDAAADALWMKRIPAVYPTLLGTYRSSDSCELVDRESFVLRCAVAVSLLSRAASFPEKQASSASSEMVQLLDVAKTASIKELEDLGFVVPSILINDAGETRTKKHKPKNSDESRRYRKPWNESASSSGLTSHHEDGTSPVVQSQRRRRLPRQGEWVEVAPRSFLRITTVSNDDSFVVATAPHDSSISVTILVDHIARVSNAMWRTKAGHEEALNQVLHQQKHLIKAHSKARLGKLHRDSEGFHKHGAARNQGFPNIDVSLDDLASMENAQDSAVLQPPSVQVFSSDDTLDANYVLTSPELIHVQNQSASKVFDAQRRAPGGLWNPIDTAAFKTVGDASLESPVSVTKTKRGKRDCAKPRQDDWETLQRDMQALLGLGTTSPVEMNQQPAMDTDVDCFITTVPEATGSDGGSPSRLLKSASTPVLSATTVQPSLVLKSPTATPKPKRLAALSWHQVATKPQLRVDINNASPLLYSPTPTACTASVCGASLSPDRESRGVNDGASRPSSASNCRVPLPLTKCRVSLPTLSFSSQNEV